VLSSSIILACSSGRMVREIASEFHARSNAVRFLDSGQKAFITCQELASQGNILKTLKYRAYYKSPRNALQSSPVWVLLTQSGIPHMFGPTVCTHGAFLPALSSFSPFWLVSSLYPLPRREECLRLLTVFIAMLFQHLCEL